MDDLPIEIKRFRQLRQELGLTQQAFADALGLKGSLADIERGKTRLSGALVAALLKDYHINPLWLFGERAQKHLYAEKTVMPQVVTLNVEGSDNIALISVKASAGYANNLQDADWYQTLPAFHLPLPEYRNASFRAFQVQGDSMLPVLQSGEWVIARAEEKWSDLVDGQVYVVVLTDTLVVKKVVKTSRGLHLVSVNSVYPVIEAEASQVREVWKVTAKITTRLEQPASSVDELTREMREGFVSLRSLMLGDK